MAAIRGRDTKPEIRVRAVLDKLRVKYETHRADLPGRPDIVLRRRKKLIFVHGCFWHMHSCRYGKVRPAKNWRFWRDKRAKNRDRDKRTRRALRKLGWEIFVAWECWTKRPNQLAERIAKFVQRL